MGMFSLIDTFMNKPMQEILENLPLPKDIKMALLGNEGSFRDIFELMLAYENGEWDTISAYANKLRIDQARLQNNYFKSLEWTHQIWSSD